MCVCIDTHILVSGTQKSFCWAVLSLPKHVLLPPPNAYILLGNSTVTQVTRACAKLHQQLTSYTLFYSNDSTVVNHSENRSIKRKSMQIIVIVMSQGVMIATGYMKHQNHFTGGNSLLVLL